MSGLCQRPPDSQLPRSIREREILACHSRSPNVQRIPLLDRSPCSFAETLPEPSVVAQSDEMAGPLTGGRSQQPILTRTNDFLVHPYRRCDGRHAQCHVLQQFEPTFTSGPLRIGQRHDANLTVLKLCHLSLQVPWNKFHPNPRQVRWSGTDNPKPSTQFALEHPEGRDQSPDSRSYRPSQSTQR